MSSILPMTQTHEPLQEIVIHTPPPSPDYDDNVIVQTTEQKNVFASTLLWLCSSLRSGKPLDNSDLKV